MIVLLSQTKLPDPSNPLSDIVRAVQFYNTADIDASMLEEEINYDTIKSKLEPLRLLSFSFLDSALDLSS